MAKRITVIRRYRPEIEKKRTRRMPELVRSMSLGTGLTEGTIRLVIHELRDTILMAHLSGAAVKFEGLGTFTHHDPHGRRTRRALPPRPSHAERPE